MCRLPFQYNADSNSSLNMQKLHGACWDSHGGHNYAYQSNEDWWPSVNECECDGRLILTIPVSLNVPLPRLFRWFRRFEGNVSLSSRLWELIFHMTSEPHTGWPNITSRRITALQNITTLNVDLQWVLNKLRVGRLWKGAVENSILHVHFVTESSAYCPEEKWQIGLCSGKEVCFLWGVRCELTQSLCAASKNQ